MLKPCPNSPNCICSMYANDKAHYGEPFIPKINLNEIRDALLRYFEENKRISIIISNDIYLHASFKIPLIGFIDDVEFYFSKEENRVHYRSASRKGYSDLGVNKNRINKIRSYLQKEGVI